MSNDKILYVFGHDYNGQSLTNEDTKYAYATPSPDWQDTVKLTDNITGFTLHAGVIFGGTEDVIDANAGASNCSVYARELHSQGKYVSTVKDCTGISIIGKIVTGGTEVDHDFGNWSDQGTKKVTGCTVGTWKGGGKPVTVRCINAEKPEELPGTGPYLYVFPRPGTWYHPICVWFFMKFHRFFK